MQTSTKLDKYSPNVRKNDMSRHIVSPAAQETVIAQPEQNKKLKNFLNVIEFLLPISSGIIRNVTSKSAIAKCMSIASMRLGFLSLRRISRIKTVKLPIDDTTISTLRDVRS